MAFSDLTDLEKVAISRGRLFCNVYTIRHVASGTNVSAGLEGHVISFPQSSPETLYSKLVQMIIANENTSQQTTDDTEDQNDHAEESKRNHVTKT